MSHVLAQWVERTNAETEESYRRKCGRQGYHTVWSVPVNDRARRCDLDYRNSPTAGCCSPVVPGVFGQDIPLPNIPVPERKVSPVGPPVVPIPDVRMPLIVGMGVIGGLFFGWQAVDHLFREGMTWEEKKNILIFSGTILGIYAAVNLFDLDEKWFEPSEWPGIVEEHVQP